MDLGLSGTTALVVGASGDLGAAIATALAAEGVAVVVVARREEPLQALAAAITAAGGRALARPLDVVAADEAAWKALRAELEADFGPVGILVWAAAAPDHAARITSIPEAHWAATLATDLTALWRCAAAFLPGMAKARFGRVIALGSLMGAQGGFGEGAYAAAKAGLGGLVKSIALEYARFGVTANVVVPGRIATSRTATLGDAAAEAMRRAIPLGREGAPAEVAAVVAFVASRAASYVTGAELPVTGGRELGRPGP